MGNTAILTTRLVVTFVLLFAAFPFQTFSQVATPSLDPSRPVLMPSATGWREKGVVGVGYQEGNGVRKLEHLQIYQFDSSGFETNIAVQTGNFFMEGAYYQSQTDVKLEQYYEGQINLAQSDARVSIALAGNDFVTIGIGGRSTESTDYIDASADSEKTKQTRTIGSLSIKTFDRFYFGLGFERVKEESTYTIGVDWNNLIGGVAILLGSPGETRFRAEYSIESSDKYENQVKGDSRESIHPKTLVSKSAVEVMFSGLVFALSSEQTVADMGAKENGVYVSETKKTNNRGGVLWIPEEGLSLGFYFISQSTTSSYEDSNNLFRVNIGYLF